MTKATSNLYRCKHCKQVVERDSSKQWIRSYCRKTDRYVHLTRVRR